jgi:alanyl-tRNA synthetase
LAAEGKAPRVCAAAPARGRAGGAARPILTPAAQGGGGGAGGRGEPAQAGGRDASKLDEALDVAASEARRAAS